VTVLDVALDHRVAPHLQHEAVRAAEEVLEFQYLILGNSLRRRTSSDGSKERQAAPAGLVIDQLNGPGGVFFTLDQGFFLQGLQVAHDSIGRADRKTFADLAHRWAISTSVDLGADKVINGTLTLG